ncbi:MAG: hypothetical protein IT426_14695 [Pirellulales bacterium]|nr:hypothetical protein [Pirellulales bacterium]
MDFSGQNVPGLLAHDHAPLFGREANDETDFLLLSAGLVPRNPHAVRMPQFRLAVMRGELVLGEDEFSVGLYVVGIAILLVEGVNGQGSLDLDRLFFPLSIKDQPSAESAHGSLVALIENGIRPVGDYLAGHSRLFVGNRERPDIRLFQAHRSAAREDGEQQGKDDDREMISRHDSSHFIVREKAQISNFRFQIGYFRFRISDFKLVISEFKFQISNLKFQISNCKLNKGKLAFLRILE